MATTAQPKKTREPKEAKETREPHEPREQAKPSLSASAFTIRIARSALVKSLTRAMTALPKRTTLPILNTVLVTAAAGELTLTCSDIEVTVETKVAAVLAGSGSAALPARRLFEIVSSLPSNAVIELTIDERRARLVAGRSKFDLVGMPIDEFPHIKIMDATGTTVTDGRAFVASLVRTTTHAAPAQHATSRPAVVGALLEIVLGSERPSDDGAFLVATDGFRLARIELSLTQGRPPLVGDFLLPRPTFGAIAKLFGEDESITISGSRQQLRIVGAHSTLTALLLDERYPAYRQILGVTPVAFVIVDRAAFVDSIKRVATVAESDRVEVTFDERELTVRVSSADMGSGEDVIDCAFSPADSIPSPFTVALNPYHLIDALDAMQGEQSRIDFTSARNPLYIRDAATPESKTMCATLPLRAPGTGGV